jgi:hypothetical protein
VRIRHFEENTMRAASARVSVPEDAFERRSVSHEALASSARLSSQQASCWTDRLLHGGWSAFVFLRGAMMSFFTRTSRSKIMLQCNATRKHSGSMSKLHPLHAWTSSQVASSLASIKTIVYEGHRRATCLSFVSWVIVKIVLSLHTRCPQYTTYVGDYVFC